MSSLPSGWVFRWYTQNPAPHQHSSLTHSLYLTLSLSISLFLPLTLFLSHSHKNHLSVKTHPHSLTHSLSLSLILFFSCLTHSISNSLFLYTVHLSFLDKNSKTEVIFLLNRLGMKEMEEFCSLLQLYYTRTLKFKHIVFSTVYIPPPPPQPLHPDSPHLVWKITLPSLLLFLR